MVYEAFLQTVKQAMQEKLGENFIVTLRSILKNNGVTLDGLCINPVNAPISPTIYMNFYFSRFQEGICMDEILDEIWELYQDRHGLAQGKVKDLIYFEEAKEKIVYKLVNAKDNEILLRDLPYYPLLDLALIFYIIIDENEEGQMTALVHNEHIGIWQTTKEKILELAMKNTPQMLPAQILPMEEVLKEIAKDNLGEDYIETDLEQVFSEKRQGSSLYVLSNQTRINGSACLLYPQVLKNFANTLGKDLVVLPSSIHEVLLAVYDKHVNIEELNYMVTVINETEVPAEDQLSNHIYYYRQNENQLSIPSSFSEAGETVNLLQKLQLQ